MEDSHLSVIWINEVSSCLQSEAGESVRSLSECDVDDEVSSCLQSEAGESVRSISECDVDDEVSSCLRSEAGESVEDPYLSVMWMMRYHLASNLKLVRV